MYTIHMQLQGPIMKDKVYVVNEENLAKCEELLLNPRFHNSRMAVIRRAVASGSNNRNLFRSESTDVLHCLLEYAKSNYLAYKAFLDKVERKYAEIQRIEDIRLEIDSVRKKRESLAQAVSRGRHRRRLIQQLLFFKNGAKKVPTLKEISGTMKEYQAKWEQEASYEVLTSPEGGNPLVKRRKVYNRITKELEAEVERLKKEYEEKRKLERDNP